jgi:hypothetical protein
LDFFNAYLFSLINEDDMAISVHRHRRMSSFAPAFPALVNASDDDAKNKSSILTIFLGR